MGQSFYKLRDEVEIDKYGNTPLMRAVKMSKSSKEVSTIISQRPSDVNMKNKEGFTPLHEAVKRVQSLCRYDRELEVIEKLLDIGADVDAVCVDGETALHCAIIQTNYCKIDPKFLFSSLLIDRGADVNIKNKEENTALHFAAGAPGGEIIIPKLLVRGAKVDLTNMYGQTALHIAAQVCSVDKIHYLLASGAEVNKRDKKGRTPLHLAVKYSRFSNISALLDWGAVIEVRDHYGATPFYYTPNYEDEGEVMELFYDHVAKFKLAKLPLPNQDEINWRSAVVIMRGESSEYNPKWVQEVNKIKKTIGRYSLFDVLRELNDPLFLLNPEIEMAIKTRLKNKTHLKKEFPVYGYLLLARFCKSRRRLRLLEEGQHSLEMPLPTEMIRKILSYLDNEDIANVIKARGKAKSAQH